MEPEGIPGHASSDPKPEKDDQGRIKLTIEGALRDAYRNANPHEDPDAEAEPGGEATKVYVVDEIEVHGRNPITDYKVVIKPKP